MTIMIGNTAIGGNESIFWMNDQAVRMVRSELQYQANIVIANEHDDSGDWWNSVRCPDPDNYFQCTVWDINVWVEDDGRGEIFKVAAYPVYKQEDGTFLSDTSVWITLEYQNA
jgi:hypothetical protein